MRVSEKRRQRIYGAVYDEIMKVRVELASSTNIISGRELDSILFEMQHKAASAAVDAATKAFRR